MTETLVGGKPSSVCSEQAPPIDCVSSYVPAEGCSTFAPKYRETLSQSRERSPFAHTSGEKAEARGPHLAIYASTRGTALAGSAQWVSPLF